MGVLYPLTMSQGRKYMVACWVLYVLPQRGGFST